ncbi:ty3-gypsy retrotransposon protein [Tanacetum coccineum]
MLQNESSPPPWKYGGRFEHKEELISIFLARVCQFLFFAKRQEIVQVAVWCKPLPRLSEAPILGLPSFENMLIVEADASDVGIGAVIMQNGKPLSYFSRRLGPRMRLAATYQKELFAIVEAVYKWRQYFLGHRFTICTDHRSLKELMQQVIQTPLQYKYVRKLMGFNFAIEYKTGTTNMVADALSRVYDAAFMALSQPLVSLVDDLRKENETLDELKIIHQKLERKEVLDGFRQEQGMILFRDRYFI